MQNIPIRSEVGRQIRDAFIAAPGHVLIAADYSQIELRLAAHMADVPELKEAFAQGQDIHAATAIELFGEVNRDTRAKAKTVNFSILYGISRWGLAGRLEITPDEAQALISRYFERFPGISDYIQGTLASAAIPRPCSVERPGSRASRRRTRTNARAANAPRSMHRSRAPAPTSSSAR